ncbi:MAG TPA: penicillin-binding protein activator [Pseudomonadales bacterium]|nr:penicillin-binding protein activator [Pseudomonadales bacterium]MDP7313966.1 penicillin-binding protein activator [Pseudomonadales bacterium]HJP52578.1 penicillin-binding protein activator [Pseudomonadales bacterium]
MVAEQTSEEPAPVDEIQSILSSTDKTTSARGNNLRLRAAEMATANRDLQEALTILSSVDDISDRSNAIRYILLQAEIAIQQNDSQRALMWLADNRLSATRLTQQDQIEVGQLRARAYFAGRNYIASARERIFFDSLLTPSEREDNRQEIFRALLELPARSLASQAKKAITSELRGWLSLAAMTKQHQNDPLKQLRELNRWKKVWSSHPAAVNLPNSLQTLSKVVANQPKTIALLLPLHGNLGTIGRSIRDGILAARFKLESDVNIYIYDTSTDHIQTLVNRAVGAGAEIIIGPLERSLVTELAQMDQLPVPVLALNRAEKGITQPDLYQFGLAPEDEMVQVADQVFKEGKRDAIAIYPDTDWGVRNYSAFRNRWVSLGGNIIDTAEYTQQRDYSDLIKSLLDVDQSEQRAADLRRITGQKFEFTPRRRQDIDFVFLLGNQSQARGINPTLAFFYAEDIPVYSTSHIYEFNDSRIESIDLNGIRFCDIPWKLTDTDIIQTDVQSAWSNSKTQLAPFYALGVDAFRLYPRLQQLKEVSDTRIFGATGVLRLNPDNVLVRKLMWAQFTDGQVVSRPLVMESL